MALLNRPFINEHRKTIFRTESAIGEHVILLIERVATLVLRTSGRKKLHTILVFQSLFILCAVFINNKCICFKDKGECGPTNLRRR